MLCGGPSAPFCLVLIDERSYPVPHLAYHVAPLNRVAWKVVVVGQR